MKEKISEFLNQVLKNKQSNTFSLAKSSYFFAMINASAFLWYLISKQLFTSEMLMIYLTAAMGQNLFSKFLDKQNKSND